MTDSKLPHKFSLWESVKKFLSSITCGDADHYANFQQFEMNNVKKTNQDVGKVSFGRITYIRSFLDTIAIFYVCNSIVLLA